MGPEGQRDRQRKEVNWRQKVRVTTKVGRRYCGRCEWWIVIHACAYRGTGPVGNPPSSYNPPQILGIGLR